MAPAAKAARAPTVLGRYVMFDEIAAGGMATVHFGRMRGERGFARTVAIKRLLPQLAADPDFVAMFVDEAKLASRVRHPHVVAPLDIILYGERDLLLVMEYVHGETLARLIRASHLQARPIPPPIAVAIMAGALYGLDAAHEAKSDQGEQLHIVHRDVSPQNVLVGIDGVARVLDFGIAKANMRASITRERTTKGKFSYMSPEQVRQQPIDRRTDVFAAGIVLWEALTGRKLFLADDPQQVMVQIMRSPILPPSRFNPRVSSALNAVVAKALSRPVDRRYATAWQFAEALEKAVPPATPREVGAWVNETVGEVIAARERRLAQIEKVPVDGDEVPAGVPEPVAAAGSGPTPGPASLSGSVPAYVASSGFEIPVSGTPLVSAEVVPSIVRRPVSRARRAVGMVAGVAMVASLSVWMLSSGEPDEPPPIRIQAGAPEAPPAMVIPPAGGNASAKRAAVVRPPPVAPAPVGRLPSVEPPPEMNEGEPPSPEALSESMAAPGIPVEPPVPAAPPIGSPERPVVFEPLAAPSTVPEQGDTAGGAARPEPGADRLSPRPQRRRARALAERDRPPRRAPARPQRPTARADSTARAAERAQPCETPYTVDARGIRRIKPECLKR